MENIYKKLNKAIDYLEEHLFEEVSYGEITAKSSSNFLQITRLMNMSDFGG